MSRAERRADYQLKMEATEAQLRLLDDPLGYAGPGVWFGIGITAVGLVSNQNMGASLGVMLAIAAFAWRSGLKEERGRLSCYRKTLLEALNSTASDE
jgi:hypothetical protein